MENITSKVPSLCLNMIVKNESKIITRLLDSVCDIIDAYCICDTGSTDNTVDIIHNYFLEKKIPGEIIFEPFKDFGHNRSFSLKACDNVIIPKTGMPPDFALLLDADMILKKNPHLSSDDLKRFIGTYDTISLFQGSDRYYYQNVRIVRVNHGYSYWGVTHEYVKSPPNMRQHLLDKNILFINDIGDGGAKTDKFLRDIRLLEKGLEELPNNDRYTFYLANSYRDSGQLEKAIETYKKRIEIGGWHEEVWYSYYAIGNCWKRLNDMERAICAWMDGYQFFPNRIENLYEIMHHYRVVGKNRLGYIFYVMADKMRKLHPERNYLFMHRDIYDYKIDFEMSIIGYYCNLDGYDINGLSMKILSDPNVEDYITNNVLSNYKFTVEKLILWDTKEWKNDGFEDCVSAIGNDYLRTHPEFEKSTPTFVAVSPIEWLVNVRLVDYKINASGGYENRGKITTINRMAFISKNVNSQKWEILKEDNLQYDFSLDDRYVGIEDIRLFYEKENTQELKEMIIYYCGNRGLSDGTMNVEHGEINYLGEGFHAFKSKILRKENQPGCEKNWVMFNNWNYDSPILNFIYNWGGNEMQIGELISEPKENVNFEIKTKHKTCPLFRKIRGSTNGITMPNDETWFIGHVVSYEDRRYYYHILVILDNKTMKVKQYSKMFSFEKEKVEYCLGFQYIRSSDSFLIGYSTLDRSTKFMTIPKSWFLERLICL